MPPVLDFTSALYLGISHENCFLKPWTKFTTGKPAALAEPAEARVIARALADLQGAEAGILAASTLHLAWDLFVVLGETDSIEIFMDAGTYPIARWGIERAAGRGVPVRQFAHHDATDLDRATRHLPRGTRPLVVADGFCPGCGRPAPLDEYLACAEKLNGWLAIDDTQALGVLGAQPASEMPYGYGGGGSLRHCSLRSPRALAFSSLAKGFGVPMAVLAGSQEIVTAFERRSSTRVHCSPPSIPTFHAARHALALNRRCGHALRTRLLDGVIQFRNTLRTLGIGTTPTLFPVQTFATSDPIRVHERLLQENIQTVLQRKHGGPGARVTLLLTARHTPRDIERVTAAIAAALKQNSNGTNRNRLHAPTRHLAPLTQP